MSRTVVAVVAALICAGVIGYAVTRGPERRSADAQDSTPVVISRADTLPPALPAAGSIDSLIGLATAPAESLPRFETQGIDYETLGITVYRSQGTWYLAGLKDGGRAWIARSTTLRFIPLGELVMNRLNYLTPSWDSRIRESADESSSAREVTVKRDNGEAAGKVLESSTAGGSLAFRVEVYEQSPCETNGAPKVIATGWVSAWAKDGKPNVWFYSRGC